MYLGLPHVSPVVDLMFFNLHGFKHLFEFKFEPGSDLGTYSRCYI